MPKETRELAFSHREVETAVGLYLDAAKGEARSKHVTEVILDDGFDIGATVKLSIALPDGKNKMHLQAGQLGAAIIVLCKKTRVPLPKSAKKSLQKDEDGLTMKFVI